MIDSTLYSGYPEEQLSTAVFWPVFFLLLVVAGVVAMGPAQLGDFTASLILVALTALSFGVFRRAAAHDPEAQLLFRVLVLAWLLKVGASLLRLHLIVNVYRAGDALGYHGFGQEIAALLSQGVVPQMSRIWGTEFVNLVTGILYLVIGPSLLGAFFIFAWLALVGMLLHYKAFVIAFPEGRRRLFMALVFLYPSILFWPASLGKDALVAFCLGLVAYGAARLYRGGLRPGPIFPTGFGLGLMLLVRPHVAAIAAVALVGVVLLQPIRAGALTPFIRLAGLAISAALAVVVVNTASSFIGFEELSVEEISEFAEETAGSTAAGGAAFEPTGLPTTPQAIALAAPNVLFRPYPWEARSLLLLATSAEGALLALLMLWRIRSVFRAIVDARRNGYLAFVFIYSALFMYLFSVIGNFAILARQRVQVLPFVFVWIAYLGLRPRGDEEPTF